MSDQTSIEWTDATWNPVTGCTKVSPGCDHCYAETLYNRFHGKGAFDTVTLHPERLDVPQRWRKPRKVFVNSMSDLFHKDVPDEYIARVFAVMAATPQHTYQVLTKRHARMRAWASRCEPWDGYITHNGEAPSSYGGTGVIVGRADHWPLPNVWLGVSVEDQQWADIRIPALRGTPAAVRFLSCEPLLGPVYLRGGWLHSCEERGCTGCASPIHWVIAGGESGPGARPMHPDWARSLRDQCMTAGVPFLFKQWGNWRELLVGDYDKPIRQTHHFGDDTTVIRVGKGAAGRELDGRTWDEFPVGGAR